MTVKPDSTHRPKLGSRTDALRSAISNAQDFLLSQQAEDGHWCGELEGDTILESEYILTLTYLGRGGDAKVHKAAKYLRQKQLDEGGWAIYRGGPPEISASVKAYFVLKLLGDDPDSPPMVRARRAILERGGIEAANTFTKIYLAIFGQYPWKRCPAVPPEMILLPQWFPFHIYKMSSWSRTIVVPLSILWAHKPRCPVPAAAAIDELYSSHGSRIAPVNSPVTPEGRFWFGFFKLVDVALKGVERWSWTPWRKRALRAAEDWTLARLRKSDGLGAIFPPIINTIVALDCLGYSHDHPVLAGQIHELEKLEIEEENTLRVQPCFSPVWDTALVMNGLLESGLPSRHPGLLRGGRWLLDKEIHEFGDWKVHNPQAKVGGWYFEYQNEFYPDCDDTAEVLTVLSQIEFPSSTEEELRRGAIDRGLSWLLSMQNDDGGWAAFDRGCDQEVLTYIPFADHNAMIDPSSEDITGRILETLDRLGVSGAPIERAIRYLRWRQERDGTWYGRWGCNHIYGTWLVVCGFRRVGVDLSADRYQRIRSWLAQRQNPDGGWGESPRSYDEPETRGRGASTAAQTAWALMALDALGEAGSPRVQRGISYLLEHQRSDGSWTDEFWTGTGFPRVFYLQYHLYATYFSLQALATCQRSVEPDAASPESIFESMKGTVS